MRVRYIKETIKLDHQQYKQGPGTLMQQLPEHMIESCPVVLSSAGAAAGGMLASRTLGPIAHAEGASALAMVIE